LSRGFLPSVVHLSVHEAAIMRRLWPTRGCCAKGGKEEKVCI